jgi:hypothetical protein
MTTTENRGRVHRRYSTMDGRPQTSEYSSGGSSPGPVRRSAARRSTAAGPRHLPRKGRWSLHLHAPAPATTVTTHRCIPTYTSLVLLLPTAAQPPKTTRHQWATTCPVARRRLRASIVMLTQPAECLSTS